MKTLTPRQEQILRYIYIFTKIKGFSPKYNDIGAKFNMSATGTVPQHLAALEKKGYIRKVTGRGVLLTPQAKVFINQSK